jgi:hypothetical protein
MAGYPLHQRWTQMGKISFADQASTSLKSLRQRSKCDLGFERVSICSTSGIRVHFVSSQCK